KFDYVPVLVGKQGSGKSTIVRWLAVEDDWFTELTTMEGKESIEQLTGAWICEITELLALSRVKEQEAVKSFLSRQRDRYRRPYDREVTEQPRQCVFLGTTNRRQFLRDRTGNRRFCPVEVHTTGAELYAKEAECRAEILQCWAEAVELYERGKLSAVADTRLLQDFEDVQREAMEEDWRVGAIERYVYRCPEDYFFCVRDVARNGLVLGMDNPRDPTPQESREIALILDSLPILERAGRKYLKSFGRQRVWKRAGLGDGLDADS
ncbi:MAG: virulence-associated protein E, partial [Oscillospiraceae bacterium]|nr:virulence-associated protein E [Oscillospiraceae bacterium]